MITDSSTNKVYFSKYLKSRKCWQNIEKALTEHDVPYGLLPGTADIWARDFMPIQLAENEFVGYTYDPDYLKDDSRHITRQVRNCYDFIGKGLKSIDLVIDGGNVIKCGDKIIMTHKVFLENKDKTEDYVRSKIEQAFGCDLVIIPWDTVEKCGHSDGMVRYVKPGHVVINYYSDMDEPLREKMLEALSPHFGHISELCYGKNARIKSWAHLNFLRVGNIIFVPQMDIASDKMACEQLQAIYKECKIVPVNVSGIVRDDGALNCVSWNIQESHAPEFESVLDHYNNKMHEFLMQKKDYTGSTLDIFKKAMCGTKKLNEHFPDENDDTILMDMYFSFTNYIYQKKQISVQSIYPEDSTLGLPYFIPFRFSLL